MAAQSGIETPTAEDPVRLDRKRKGKKLSNQDWVSKSDPQAFKLRAAIVERSFAHILDRGGMRRTWLRGRENVHKRYLLHVAGHNLSLPMRQIIGAGTPKEAVAAGYGAIFVFLTLQGALLVAILAPRSGLVAIVAISPVFPDGN